MAWQTAVPYTHPATGNIIPAGAYFKIDSTQFDHKAQTANISCGLYFNKAARTAGLAPLLTFDVAYLASSSVTGNQYAQILPFPATQADSNPDNLVARLYDVLPQHPALAALLSGAVSA